MRILIHICCAPCFTYPHKKLREQGHEVVGFWYNPNIHPFLEYKAREDSVKKYAFLEKVEIIYGEYELSAYLQRAVKANERDERCIQCYEYRLEKTATYAKEKNYDAFTTTLLVSRHQKHNNIKKLGMLLSEKYSIPFHYVDFREGWNQGKAIATHYSLYRQKYCGCIYSEWERYQHSQ